MIGRLQFGNTGIYYVLQIKSLCNVIGRLQFGNTGIYYVLQIKSLSVTYRVSVIHIYVF